MCAQIEFAWSKRVAKPTMQEHDCAVRLTFFLDMDDRWHLKVHGLIDQGEFRVPLNHTVRGERSALPHAPQARGGGPRHVGVPHG